MKPFADDVTVGSRKWLDSIYLSELSRRRGQGESIMPFLKSLENWKKDL